jgi:transmembrane sensor
VKTIEGRIQESAADIEPNWTPERAQAVHEALLARARRRQQRTRAAVALAVIGAFAGVTLRLARPNEPTTVVAGETSIQFQDGSRATILNPTETSVWLSEEGDERIVVQLRGAAHFEVTKNRRRTFRVETGTIAVEVIGTRFRVEPEGTRTRVSVEEGRVAVLARNGDKLELGVGESEIFPRPARHVAEEPAAEPRPSIAAAPSRRPRPVAPSWVELAERGDYDAAYAAYARPPSVPRLLLLASDVARFSHHPVEAIEPLERLMKEHPGDPLAPMASFTLGRVLLDELGRPREAARAFAATVEAAPEGPLAEDALARCVEAWYRAGELGDARARALEYLQRYPEGRRIRAVHTFGGVP